MSYFSKALFRESSPAIIKSFNLPFSDKVTNPDRSKSDTDLNLPDIDVDVRALSIDPTLAPPPPKPYIRKNI